MKKALFDFLCGMGSIFELFPSSATYTPESFDERFGTPEERMRETWERVGDHLRWAMYSEWASNPELQKALPDLWEEPPCNPMADCPKMKT